MKTKSCYLILFLSSIVFLSCENDINKSPDVIINKSPVHSVSVSSITNNKVSFLAKASWPDGCGSFSHFTSIKIDTIFYITVFGKRPTNAVCTLAVIELDAPIDIFVGESGRFTFRFSSFDTATVDTTITF